MPLFFLHLGDQVSKLVCIKPPDMDASADSQYGWAAQKRLPNSFSFTLDDADTRPYEQVCMPGPPLQPVSAAPFSLESHAAQYGDYGVVMVDDDDLHLRDRELRPLV